MNVSSKKHIVYRLATCLGEAECHIYCVPRQKWDAEFNSENVRLSRKNVTLVIPKDDFEKHWKEV